MSSDPVLRLEVREPANGQLIEEVTVPTAAAVEAMIARARAAASRWAGIGAKERGELLLSWRRELVADADRLVSLVSRENGKPRHEALVHELLPLVDMLGWIAAHVSEVFANEAPPARWLKHREHEVRQRARGVTALIEPFNFPLLLPVSEAAAALAAGCTVLIKPSERVPLTALRAVELAHRAGIPTDVLQVVPGGPDMGRMLIEAGVDQVRFTGHGDNGRDVAVTCARHLIFCSLELGGNAPMIVLEDVDVDRAARAIVFGALSNSGQSCVAVGRVLVNRRLQQPLADRLATLVGRLRQGDPKEHSVDLGALTTEAQLERCQRHVDDALDRGARLRHGGHRRPGSGRYYAPTILTDTDRHALVATEETFGPIIALVPYDRTEEAIEWVHLGQHGLAAYVFGTDLGYARQVALKIEAAHVLVDDVLSSYACAELPFAPLGKSGTGVVHGVAGLRSHAVPTVLGMPKISLPARLQFRLASSPAAAQVARGLLRAAVGGSSWARRLFLNYE